MTQVYFVATPIGNLTEITYRAIEVLNSVDLIYCEDTRTTRVVLDKYNISKPLRSYHKFNEKATCDTIIQQLVNGSSIAVVSDAGMPAICDPGSILVNRLIEANIGYTVISGACAFVNAIVLSGFESPFTFLGFLPKQGIDKDRLLDSVNVLNTLILYSSVHDVEQDLDYLHQRLGARRVCIVREISKLYESVLFGELGKVQPDVLKGEFVLLVSKSTQRSALCDLSIAQHVQHYITMGVSKKDAIKSVANERGVAKNVIYSALIDKS